MNKFLLIILTFCLSINSEKISIGILEYYNLKKIKIQFKDLKIIVESSKKSFSNGNLEIEIKESKVQYKMNSQLQTSSFLKISSNENLILEFEQNQNTIQKVFFGEFVFYNFENRLEIIYNTEIDIYAYNSALSELGELANNSPELVMAQAILIKTYILNQKNRHRSRKFSFCDLTHCVHLKNSPKQKINFLLPNLIGGEEYYFHSTCGGKLSSSNGFWNGLGFSTSRNDDIYEEEILCKESPHSEWEYVMNKQKLEELIQKKIQSKIVLTKQNERVMSLNFKTEDGDYELKSSKLVSLIGKKYGWNLIKSNYFELIETDFNFIFKGKGLGHGIGLCQWGAKKLSDKNFNHKEILKFYFPKSKLNK